MAVTKPFSLIIYAGQDAVDPRLADVVDYALDHGAYLEIRTDTRYISDALWDALSTPPTQMRLVLVRPDRPADHCYSVHAIRNNHHTLDFVTGAPIGQVIRTMRLARGWSQRQLAEEVSALSGTHWGMSQIWNWENHQQLPTPRAIEALAEVLGLGRTELEASVAYARRRPRTPRSQSRTARSGRGTT